MDCGKNQICSGNMRKQSFYVCPVCGNIIQSVGQGKYSCCGNVLPALEAEKPDVEHEIKVEVIDNEYYVSIEHPMTKEHYISFLAYVTSSRAELVKLYPEQNAEARLAKRGHGILYAYCNQHGLFQVHL